MEWLALIAVVALFAIMNWMHFSHRKEMDRLWQYTTHIEAVLRANRLWVVKWPDGKRSLGEVTNPDLSADGLKE